MPVEWVRRGRVVVVRTVGNYSNAEVRAAIDQAAADPEFQAGTSLVFDGTQSEAPISKQDMEWRVALLRTLPSRGFSSRVAIIVRADERYRFGLARQLSMLVEPHEVELKPFPDVEAAMAWLSATPD
jgi:hypothetical protein